MPTPRANSSAVPRPPAKAAKQGFASRLFGYDVFISFALGEDARGSRSYASDLARQLSERDYTVFFSEDEAPPGSDLDDALKRALERSRILVVVVNRGTLANPRWVRVEVEEFRRLHPGRPVIPINIGGALQDPELGPAAEAWLRFSDKIWIDDSEQAGRDGIVSADTLERLITAPTAVRASTRWRWTVRVAFTVLAAITAAALWFAWSDRQNATLAEERRALAERNAEEARDNAALAAKNEERAVANAAAAERESERAVKAEGEALREAEAARAAERRALSGRLAAESQLARGSDTRLALLLAREAWAVDRTREARRALFEALHEPVPTVLASGLGEIRSMDYSADGRFVAAATWKDVVHLWRLDGAAPAATELNAASGLRSLAFSPDGTRLATLDSEARLQLWDPERGTAIGAPIVDPEMAEGWALAWHPQDPVVAVGTTGADRRQLFQLWDLATRAPVGEALRTDVEYGVFDVSFSPDGERLAATVASELYVWDLATRELVVPPIRGRSPTRGVLFVGNDEIVFDGPGYEATAWSLWRNEAVKPTFGGHTNWVGALAHSPAGRLLATGSEDMSIRLWTERHAHEVRGPLRLHDNGISGLAFSADGARLVSAARDGRVVLWLLDTGSHRFRAAAVTGIERHTVDLTVSADLRHAVLLWPDTGRLEWRDLVTGAAIEAPGPVSDAWEGRAVAADGTVAMRQAGDVLALYPRGQATPRCTLSPIPSVAAFDPGGRWLVTSSTDDGALRLWQASDCREVAAIPRDGRDAAFRPAAFSADGRELLVADEEGIRRWDLARRRFESDPAYASPKAEEMAVDPRGRFIATSHDDGLVRLIDLRGGSREGALLGQHGRTRIRALAFSADGLWLATVGDDDRIALWDLEAGQLAGTPIEAGQGQLRGVAFSPDSRTLITVGTDGPPAKWNVDADAWAATACEVAQSNLTCAEWRRVMGEEAPYRRSCGQWPPPPDAARCGAR